MYRLCVSEKNTKKINITIVTLIDNGFFEPKLRKMGIKIFSLKINKEDKIFNLFRKYFHYENISIKIPILFKAGCTIQILQHSLCLKNFMREYFGILDIQN